MLLLLDCQGVSHFVTAHSSVCFCPAFGVTESALLSHLGADCCRL